jgi:hypothetical protein
MDKNFINIDDLVRQRLSGGEEQERSGSWLRMRELLDKEEQKDPVGFFSWRRMFSAVALLLLIATLSIGGYKMSSSTGSAGTGGSTAPAIDGPLASAGDISKTTAAAPGANTPGAGPSATAKQNDREVYQLKKSQAILVSNHTNTPAAGPSERVMNNPVATNTDDISTPGNNALATTDHKAAKNHQARPENVAPLSNSTLSSSTLPGAKQPGNVGSTSRLAANDNKTTGEATGLSPASESVKNPDNNKTASAINKKIAKHVAANNNTQPLTAQSVNGNAVAVDNDKPGTAAVPHKAAGKKQGVHILSATTHISKATASCGKIVPPAATAPAGKKDATASAARKNNKTISSGTHVALASSVSRHSMDKKALREAQKPKQGPIANAANNAPVAAATKAKKDRGANKAIAATVPAQHTGARSLAVNSHAPATSAAKAINAKKTARKTNTSNTSASVNKPGPTAPNNRAKSSPVVASSNTPGHTGKANNQPKLAGPSMDPQYGGSTGNAAHAFVAPIKSEKLVMEKMKLIVQQRRSSPDNTQFHFDTVSITDFTRQYVVTNPAPATSAVPATPAVQAPRTSAARKAGGPGNSGANTSSSSGVNNTSSSTQILPAAAPSSSAGKSSAAKAALGSKAPATKGSVAEMGDNTTGAEKLANINQAFNDIKYKVGAAKFIPGITAGINGTFFGPSSFKGFQFGFAGTFVFGDAWSILTELEYFHRINNNYSLNDDYYSAANKQVNNDVYAFSTLHSFELPVSARYHAGAFNFFAGVNFVYTLAINTDSTQGKPLPATTQPAGMDNSPKLNVTDFGSTFGVGYLVGLSYQVSPNVIIDFRNVQTVWDNAKSTGGKYISGQLYQSPSLQLSMIYRFGGNKSRN